MPLRVASSFSEAELMSIGADDFVASFLASAFASALASDLAGAFISLLAGAFISDLGVSAFWAKARPVAAMAATRKAKILFMLQVLLWSVVGPGFWGPGAA